MTNKKPKNVPTNIVVLSNLETTTKNSWASIPNIHFISYGKIQKKRIVIKERINAIARGGGEARRGSGFPAALYPNPGFGNGMRRTQVNTNASNNSTDTGLVGGGEQLCVK